MNAAILNAFMSGAIALGFATIAGFFFEFWRRTRVSLFALFAAAFALLAVERVVLVCVDAQDEFRAFVYLIRLGAFLLIIGGVVLQNRHPG
jgi:hypothetical protein